MITVDQGLRPLSERIPRRESEVGTTRLTAAVRLSLTQSRGSMQSSMHECACLHWWWLTPVDGQGQVLMGVACRKPQGWGGGTRYAKSQPDGLTLLARHIGQKCQCVRHDSTRAAIRRQDGSFPASCRLRQGVSAEKPCQLSRPPARRPGGRLARRRLRVPRFTYAPRALPP